eukprot:TRINITY_DN101339_c0_g1_i1.p1 TRINITY_DN101339_c0_g1~~TRINITY_DN101339_c0_g1_i1.p1  ORF type:complete len:306 (-),score=55.98 TRINITY_DN101339_c0_g1_i1:160-1032(-)
MAFSGSSAASQGPLRSRAARTLLSRQRRPAHGRRSVWLLAAAVSSAAAVSLAALGLTAGKAPKSDAFLSPAPRAGRRSVFNAATMLGLSAMLPWMQEPLPANAKDKTAPPRVEVSGVMAPYGKANGLWSIVPGKQVNDRAVYELDSQDREWYLVYNNCGQFQLGSTMTGECDGWAIEKKGEWEQNGLSGKKEPAKEIKLKPLKEGDQPVNLGKMDLSGGNLKALVPRVLTGEPAPEKSDDDKLRDEMRNLGDDPFAGFGTSDDATAGSLMDRLSSRSVVARGGKVLQGSK